MNVLFGFASFLGAFVSILAGLIVLTDIPTKLGVYRFHASQSLQHVGYTPAHHYGIPWNFTKDEFEKCEGQSAVVTGGNAGIGYELALGVARRGASRVTIACRNMEKCKDAAGKIKNEVKDPSVVVDAMHIDLASLDSVKAFARTYGSGKVDMLFLNAGGLFTDYEKDCVDIVGGVERVFLTNYLSHHLLYRLLEQQLNDGARVVSTSSCSSFYPYSYGVATDLETLNSCDKPYYNKNFRTRNYSYGQSKLAQILWTRTLQKRVGNRIFVNAFHPGAVNTNIWGKGMDQAKASRPSRNLISWLQTNAMWTQEEGAHNGLFLGLATQRLRNDGIYGRYFHPQGQEVLNPFATNVTLQDDLWRFSNDLVSTHLQDSEV